MYLRKVNVVNKILVYLKVCLLKCVINKLKLIYDNFNVLKVTENY